MAKIRIGGTIVSNDERWIYRWFDMDAFCPNDLRKQITNDNEELNIEINSPGGSVFAGSEIYTALKNHKGKVNVSIVGLAASSASVIAMAGDTVKMSPTAQLMIHNVSTMAHGDYREMEHTSLLLKQANETIANAYVLKTGKVKEELLEMMNQEKWFTPEEALENKFVDEIMFTSDSNIDLQLVAGVSGTIIPVEVIQQMQQKKKQMGVELELLELGGIK